MKARLGLTIAIPLLILPTLAFSDVATRPYEEHTVELGIETQYFDYHEKGVTIDGPLYGVYGAYTYHGEKGLMASASLALSYGELDYDGRTWDGSPADTDTDDRLVDLRILAGSDWRVREDVAVTPFLGLGYWYWNNDIRGSGGYERETTYWYAPMGVQTVGPVFETWQWGVWLEYDLFLGGTVKSHLSDARSGFNDPEVDLELGDGYGVRCSVWVAGKVGEGLALKLEPFLTYWNIDESDTAKLKLNGSTVGYVYEPGNDTTACGLRLTVAF
jgi:hypothetical protein